MDDLIGISLIGRSSGLTRDQSASVYERWKGAVTGTKNVRFLSEVFRRPVLTERVKGEAGTLSIRAFEGSRLRLLRTRSAMGFKCRFGTHSTLVGTVLTRFPGDSHLCWSS